MRIDPAQPQPVFAQIADALRARVASGVYMPGDIVPSIRDMAVRLMVNPNTVKRAYDELEREGVLEARKGVGMFVRLATARPARARSGEALRDSLERALRQARDAGMTKSAIDACYDDAWAAVRRDHAQGDSK